MINSGKKLTIVAGLLVSAIAASGASTLRAYHSHGVARLTETRTIAVNIQPAHSVPPNTYCTFTANVSGGVAPYHYAWYANNSPVGFDSPQLSYLTGTSGFRLQAFVTDANNDQGNDSKIITIYSLATC